MNNSLYNKLADYIYNHSKWLFIFLIIVPPVTVLFFINYYSINIPYMDQWNGFLNTFISYKSGSLHFSNIWAQHNEHRPLFPLLIMIILASLSHWNVIWEQYTGLVLQACTFFFILNMGKKTFSFQWRYTHLCFNIISSMLLFSMVQYENWAWGWQIQIFLNIFAVTFSIWAISRWPNSYLGLLFTVTGAIIATYSFANGMLIWPIIFIHLLSSDTDKKKQFILIWTITGLAVFFSYIYGYEKPSYHPSLLSFLNNPIDFIIFFFSYIGSPIGVCYGLTGSAFIGALGIFAFLYIFVNESFIKHNDFMNRYSLWIWLILYTILSAVVTGAARSGFSANQALYSRYTSFSLLFWVALFAILLTQLELFRAKIFLKRIIHSSAAIFFTFFIFSHSLSYAQGIISFKKHSGSLSNIYHLLKYEKLYGADGMFSILFPSLPELFNAIETLKQLELGVFYKDIKKPSGIYIQGEYFNMAGTGGSRSFSRSGLLILEKDSQVSLKINIHKSGDYMLLADLGFSTDNGTIFLMVDESNIGKTDCGSINLKNNYRILKWVNYGKIFLSKGEHSITLKSLSGPNIVNAIAIEEINKP